MCYTTRDFKKQSRTTKLLLGELINLDLRPIPEYEINDFHHIDIAFPKTKIAIEIDGSEHETKLQQIKDDARDKELKELGWDVYRFNASYVHNNVEETALKIKNIIDEKRYIKKPKPITVNPKPITIKPTKSLFYVGIIIIVLFIISTYFLNSSNNKNTFMFDCKAQTYQELVNGFFLENGSFYGDAPTFYGFTNGHELVSPSYKIHNQISRKLILNVSQYIIDESHGEFFSIITVEILPDSEVTIFGFSPRTYWKTNYFDQKRISYVVIEPKDLILKTDYVTKTRTAIC